jgi:ABC-2 type transport system permease protein
VSPGALLAVAELELRRMAGGRRALVVLILLLGAAALAGAVRAWAPPPPVEDGWRFVFLLQALLWLQTLVLLVPLLHATSLVKDDEEEGTLVYLVTRPISRAGLLLAKFAAMLLFAGGSLLLGFLAFLGAFAWLGADPYPAFAHGWRFLLAAELGVLAYGGLFTLVGLVSRRGMIWGIVYGFLSEFVLATLVPALAKRLTVMHYLRSVALAGEELPEGLPGVLELSSPGLAAAAAVAVGLGCLALAALAISLQELEGPREETG